MLRFRFSTDEDPGSEDAGFSQGILEVQGENETVLFRHLMVVPTVSFMLNQLIPWLGRASCKLDVGFIDLGDEILFERKGKLMLLKYRDRLLGSAPLGEFLRSLAEAVRQLDRDFVSKLPLRDVAKQDYDSSLSAFEQLIPTLQQPIKRALRTQV